MAGRLNKVGTVGLSDDDKARRKERIGAYADLWAGMQLTGNRNDVVTGWGQWTATKEVDIFKFAAAVPKPGESPYNNWLGPQQRPLFEVYPEAIGFYIGEHIDSQNAADDQQVKALLLEHATLELKTQNGGRVIFQPGLSLPPGVGVMTYSTDSFKYTEQFGPLVPAGMFKVPENTAFSMNDTVQALLKIDANAQAALLGQAGAFPSAGCVLMVRIIGTALYNRPTGRS